jgi:hypothetical protein
VKLILAFVTLTLAALAFVLSTSDGTDPQLVTLTDVQHLTKVTAQPLVMSQTVAALCVATPQYSGPTAHAWKFFDIYASKDAAAVVQTGQGTYPVGAVVLKRKYSDASGKTTELYTGMLKREKGYNPVSGDWEYFILSSDGKIVQKQGKLADCMACHAAYSSSDYITRDYFMNRSMYDSPSTSRESPQGSIGPGFGGAKP